MAIVQLTKIHGVGQITAKKLDAAGFDTIAAIAEASIASLAGATGFGDRRCSTIKTKAQELAATAAVPDDASISEIPPMALPTSEDVTSRGETKGKAKSKDKDSKKASKKGSKKTKKSKDKKPKKAKKAKKSKDKGKNKKSNSKKDKKNKGKGKKTKGSKKSNKKSTKNPKQ